MEIANKTAIAALSRFSLLPLSFFVSIKRQGARMYVQETVKPKKLAQKRHRLTQVLAMKPFDRVTLMNLVRNLSRYLTPRVTEPIMTENSPITIAMYSYSATICVY